MKIVDQARLGFREGKSDKVYEVDLVEVASGQYVVNFRYGRRGSVLREGTKSALPLTLERARAVFAELVAEKRKGGYKPLEGAPAAIPAARPRVDAAEETGRTERALLEALARGGRDAAPLHLTVRKVGERGLSQAEPLLLELLAAKQPPSQLAPAVFRHFVIAALARCGSVVATKALSAIASDAKAPGHLRDIANLALTRIVGAPEQRRVRGLVPAALRPRADSDVNALAGALETLLAEQPTAGQAALYQLYLSAPADHETERADADGVMARRVVLASVRVAGLRARGLGLWRSLTWAAEIRRDAALFALLARRFDVPRGVSVPPATLRYFRRRAARTLRRLGGIASPDYVRFATELLLAYRSEDAEPAFDSLYGRWDQFGRYTALQYVLYGQSPRYERAHHRRATWRCRETYRPGQPAPAVREESFPALWDRAPDALWRLGCSEAAEPVIHFATRALAAQTAYLAALTDAVLGEALASAQPLMRKFALEVAKRRALTPALARAALRSGLEAAEDWVLHWLEASAAGLNTEPELLAQLIVSLRPALRPRLAQLTRSLTLDTAAARGLVLHALALLLRLPANSDDAQAASATALLLQLAPAALAELGLPAIRDLLGHALGAVAALGAELVVQRARSGALEPGLLDALLASPHAQVRALGARIVADTPPDVVKDEPVLLAHFALSDNAELRQGTRALMAEVARLYPPVGRDLAARLIDALLSPQPSGAPAHVVSLLRHELAAHLPKRDAQSVLALLRALSPHAREAGGLLLAQLGPDELELDEIARLASHEILLVRQGAWALATAAKARFQREPLALARLCDAGWDDSREFAFGFVRSMPGPVLVPDAVIAICDSVNPAVQAFGQSLLREHWQDEHAQRYLLQLSEHPSTLVQQLVSGMLQQHARGNLALLEQLLPFFATVLTQVNRGGVAKQRVLAFLREQAVASPEAATLLAPLLSRQSLTRARTQQEPLVATMVDLHARYPDVPVPVITVEPPLRARSTRGV